MAIIAIRPGQCVRQTEAGQSTHQQEPSETFGCPFIWTPVTWFTWALVVIGGVQAALFLRQLRLIRDSMDDTAAAARAATKAATAATDTLKHQQSSAERELRAYVFVRSTVFERIRPRPVPTGFAGLMPVDPTKRTTGRITFGYQNKGRTPAKHVRVAARALIIDKGEVFDVRDIGQMRDVGPMGPKDTLEEDVTINMHDQGKVQVFPNGRDLQRHVEDGKEVHLFGRIEYGDEFSPDRWTTFHMFVGGDVPWDPILHTAKNGNDYG